MHDLPDGDYPFGAEMYALSRLAMTEAPPENVASVVQVVLVLKISD